MIIIFTEKTTHFCSYDMVIIMWIFKGRTKILECCFTGVSSFFLYQIKYMIIYSEIIFKK